MMEEKTMSMECVKAFAEMFFAGTDEDVEWVKNSFIEMGYTIVDEA